MKFAGVKLREHARYATISTAVLLLIAFILVCGSDRYLDGGALFRRA